MEWPERSLGLSRRHPRPSADRSADSVVWCPSTILPHTARDVIPLTASSLLAIGCSSSRCSGIFWVTASTCSCEPTTAPGRFSTRDVAVGHAKARRTTHTSPAPPSPACARAPCRRHTTRSQSPSSRYSPGCLRPRPTADHGLGTMVRLRRPGLTVVPGPCCANDDPNPHTLQPKRPRPRGDGVDVPVRKHDHGRPPRKGDRPSSSVIQTGREGAGGRGPAGSQRLRTVMASWARSARTCTR